TAPIRNWVVDLKTTKVTEVKLPRVKLEDKEYAMVIQAWSPDGKWFLASGDGLYLVKLDGSAPRRLTKDCSRMLGGTCRFSPDGRRSAYCVTLLDARGEREGETSIFVTDPEGKNAETVLTEKHKPNQIKLRLMDWR